MQRPRDAAAVVVAELGDLGDHLREFGVLHLDLVEVELLLAVARGGTASEVKDDLDQPVEAALAQGDRDTFGEDADEQFDLAALLLGHLAREWGWLERGLREVRRGAGRERRPGGSAGVLVGVVAHQLVIVLKLACVVTHAFARTSVPANCR